MEHSQQSSPSQLPAVHLRGAKTFSHPWVFQKMVTKGEGDARPKNGSVVDILDGSGMWVGRGLYNGHARVSVRILTEDKGEVIDAAFFEKKIRAALSLRLDILQLHKVTNAFRLVHSEADGLSGVIIDLYDDLAVVEYFAAGMYRLRPEIEEAMRTVLGEIDFFGFAAEHVQKQESIDIRSPRPPKPLVIHENGLKFRVSPGSKHKTGFFVDQRENRRLLADFCADKTVLDICCNSGGFAVYAKARGRAAQVTALDIDEEVLEVAKDNAALNGAEIEFVHADLFAWLRERHENKKPGYDVVILDPAKQTRSKTELDQALKRYCDMNRLAMQAVKPGGILLTCSCSGLISEAEFAESLRRAAYQAGRQVQVFKITGAAADHPYLINVPESRYLKAFWARVF